MQLEFFFDPISPYAWLASKEIAGLSAAGFEVASRPVLFAGLLNAHGNIGPAEIAAKRAYAFRDVMRLAAQRGLRLQGPPAHPYNPLRALRLCAALDDREERTRLACSLMEATWERGADLTDTATLEGLVLACGLAARGLLAVIETPAIKDRLTAATRAAVEAGIFGVPTFRYDGELFWGSDRIGSLLWRAGGHCIDEAALAAFLQRGASAQRKPAPRP